MRHLVDESVREVTQDLHAWADPASDALACAVAQRNGQPVSRHVVDRSRHERVDVEGTLKRSTVRRLTRRLSGGRLVDATRHVTDYTRSRRGAWVEQASRRHDTRYIYDAQEHLVGFETTRGDGTLAQASSFDYDPDGRLVRQLIHEHDPSGARERSHVSYYLFAEDGRALVASTEKGVGKYHWGEAGGLRITNDHEEDAHLLSYDQRGALEQASHSVVDYSNLRRRREVDGESILMRIGYELELERYTVSTTVERAPTQTHAELLGYTERVEKRAFLVRIRRRHLTRAPCGDVRGSFVVDALAAIPRKAVDEFEIEYRDLDEAFGGIRASAPVR